jgi:hypothetical protein
MTKGQTLSGAKDFGNLRMGATMDDEFSRQTSPLKDGFTSRTNLSANKQPLTIDDKEILEVLKKVALAGRI